MEFSDDYWMQKALDLARKAQAEDEVPVGAVLVKDDQLIAEAYNQPIKLNDPSAHAEMLVLRSAGQALDNYRLLDTTLYVTLEPCSMCVGAMIHARVKRLVFGAFDPKTGAAGSAINLIADDVHNHKVEVVGGVMEEECRELLQGFFKMKRSS